MYTPPATAASPLHDCEHPHSFISLTIVCSLHVQLSLHRFHSHNSNELLDYLKSLDTHTLSELTASAGDDIIEAMNAFIHRLLDTSDEEDLRRAASQSKADELAKLLFWYAICPSKIVHGHFQQLQACCQLCLLRLTLIVLEP